MGYVRQADRCGCRCWQSWSRGSRYLHSRTSHLRRTVSSCHAATSAWTLSPRRWRSFRRQGSMRLALQLTHAASVGAACCIATAG
jgi:hypothetical protein